MQERDKYWEEKAIIVREELKVKDRINKIVRNGCGKPKTLAEQIAAAHGIRLRR